MSGPSTEDPPYEADPEKVPQIVNPIDDGMSDVPRMRMKFHEGVPYVQVDGIDGAVALDLTCTDALNLAILLTHLAGTALARRVAQVTWGAVEPDEHVSIYHTPNGTIGVYDSRSVGAS